MHDYDLGALYMGLAERLFAAQRAARAAGGTNNIPERGHGPEQAVRDMVQNMIGRSYRVTHGHVVRSDRRKSKQIDVIVVRDSPAATMHRSEYDGAELVRAEWVAAAGEVKSSWTKTADVLNSYRALVSDMQELQNDLRCRNTNRFGRLQGDGTLADVIRPITGREWLNGCYTFLIVLEMRECPIRRLATELQRRRIAAEDNAILVLDEKEGGVVCLPGSLDGNRLSCGVHQMWKAHSPDSVKGREWLVVGAAPEVHADQRAGALLSWAVGDLQLHLSSWYEEYNNPLGYSSMGERRRLIGQQAETSTRRDKAGNLT